MEYRASLLASRGYAALALDYLDSGRVLSADVEVEYFEVRAATFPSNLVEFVQGEKSQPADGLCGS